MEFSKQLQARPMEYRARAHVVVVGCSQSAPPLVSLCWKRLLALLTRETSEGR